MKATRIVMAITFVGLLATGSSAVFACGDRGDWRHGPDGIGPMRAISQLENLSDDQHKQLDALFDKERKEMRQRRDEQEELRDAMDKATDAKTLRPLAEKPGKLVTEMIMKRQEIRSEVDKILTPAQRTQLKEMTERWQDDRHDFRDHDSRDHDYRDNCPRR